MYNIVNSALGNSRAEIWLGLKKGYEGFDSERQQVLAFLCELYVQDVKTMAGYVRFIAEPCVFTYTYPKDGQLIGVHEPGLKFTADKNPFFTKGLDDEKWKNLVRRYASELAERFEQFRVYLNFTRTDLEILERPKQ